MTEAVREQTGAKPEECKRALLEHDGNVQAAIKSVLATGRDVVFYYQVQTVDLEDVLLLDDEAENTEDRIRDELRATTRLGRLNIPPLRMGLIAELEDTESHYSEEETDASIAASRVPRFENLMGFILTQESFLQALEELGVTHLKAYPVILHHPASAREWPDFFVLSFTRVLRKALLRDDGEMLFIDNKSPTPLYINEQVKTRLEHLGWDDNVLLEKLRTLFREKTVHQPGKAYSAQYFIDRLLEAFSNVDFARIKRAIDRDDRERFFYVEDAKGCWLGTREAS